MHSLTKVHKLNA